MKELREQASLFVRVIRMSPEVMTKESPSTEKVGFSGSAGTSCGFRTVL